MLIVYDVSIVIVYDVTLLLISISNPFGKKLTMGNKTDKPSIAIYRISGPPLADKHQQYNNIEMCWYISKYS